MLRFSTLFILLTISVTLQAQLLQKVDAVPYVADCDVEETIEQAVQCSEGMLLGYFLRSIDTIACPTTDTSRRDCLFIILAGI